jgi:hypothetical protein
MSVWLLWQQLCRPFRSAGNPINLQAAAAWIHVSMRHNLQQCLSDCAQHIGPFAVTTPKSCAGCSGKGWSACNLGSTNEHVMRRRKTECAPRRCRCHQLHKFLGRLHKHLVTRTSWPALQHMLSSWLPTSCVKPPSILMVRALHALFHAV